MSDYDKVFETGTAAALAGGDVLLKYFGDVSIHEKSTQNLVTQADFDSEALVVKMLSQRHPDHQVMREEGESTGSSSSEHLWIIDPLDGTNNYAHGIPQFCISIAYAYRGRVQVGVVFDPIRNEMFSAIRGQGALLNGQKISVTQTEQLTQSLVATGFFYERGEVMLKTLDAIRDLFLVNVRGVRRMGAAALDLTWVACGRMQGYFEYRLAPWDFAAGWLIVEEAGGVCRNSAGDELALDSKGVIATCPGITEELTEVVGWKESESD